MKNKRRIVGLVAALLLALVGTVSLVAYVRSAKDQAVAQEELVDVYVVDEFVPKGADPDTIKSSVEIEQVPARLLQTGAVTDLDTIGDQVAASDLQPGDQLLAARLGLEETVSDEVTDKVQISTLLEAAARRRRRTPEGRSRRGVRLVRSLRQRCSPASRRRRSMRRSPQPSTPSARCPPRRRRRRSPPGRPRPRT